MPNPCSRHQLRAPPAAYSLTQGIRGRLNVGQVDWLRDLGFALGEDQSCLFVDRLQAPPVVVTDELRAGPEHPQQRHQHGWLFGAKPSDQSARDR